MASPTTDEVSRSNTTDVTPNTKTSNTPQNVTEEPVQLTRARFILIFLSLMLCVFLFALDQLIVATAIPKITNQFHSLTEISWLANGFFITLLAFNLAFAQWLSIFPAKHVTLFAVSIFELGSLLCGVAPNMIALIIGRAIAGLGGTGIFNGALMILTEMTTFAERAKYFGLLGVCFAVASILGPLVGGAFSDHVSWRWCFYINLPIGGVALGLIILLVETRPPYGRTATYKGYGWDMLKQLAACDWMGVAIILSWGICFILGLEWGGITKPWNNPNVIACLVMSVVLAVLFFAWEWYMGEKAMLPLYMLKNHTVAGGAIVAIFTWSTFMFVVYYLSEGYQAIYDSSATKAGIDLLPQIVTQIFVLIFTGRIIARFGRSYWIIVAGPCFLLVGSGLLYSVAYPDSKSFYLGYSAIIGIGIGCVLQNTIIAVQYVFHKEPQLISIGTGTVTFFAFAGRNLGISLAGSVFGNMLQVNLHKYAPGLPPRLVTAVQNNAGAVYSAVPEPLRPPVLKAYMKTLSAVFVIGIPASAIALVGALIMGNYKMDMSQGAPDSSTAAKKPADIEKGSTPDDGDDDDDEEKVREKNNPDAPPSSPQPPVATEGSSTA